MHKRFLFANNILASQSLRKRDVKMEEKKYETECKGCKKPIKGVTCDVKSCVYNDGKSDCFAEKIYVGPTGAKTSDGTLCATFKAREY